MKDPDSAPTLARLPPPAVKTNVLQNPFPLSPPRSSVPLLDEEPSLDLSCSSKPQSSIPSVQVPDTASLPVGKPSSKSPTEESQGRPFLSLPPEIRSLIYAHLFTEYQDGTCRTIYLTGCENDSPSSRRLLGYQVDCSLCTRKKVHDGCIVFPEDLMPATVSGLVISGGRLSTNILRTCRTAFCEALPVLRESIHICLSLRPKGCHFGQPLTTLVERLRFPAGTFLPHVSLHLAIEIYKSGHIRHSRLFYHVGYSSLVSGIRVRQLDIRTTEHDSIHPGTAHILIKEFANGIVLSKPKRIKWEHCEDSGLPCEDMIEHTTRWTQIVNKWLAKWAKASRPDVPIEESSLWPQLSEFFSDA